MKTFIKTPPTSEGWYWVRYRGKHGWVKCPALILIFKDKTTISSAYNDFFVCGSESHKEDKTLSFGPNIKMPKVNQKWTDF